MVDMQEIIIKLMKSQVQAHVWHLNTKKYELHITLEDYYSSITDLVDSLAEKCDSRGLGLIPSFNMGVTNDPSSALEYFNTLRDDIDSKLKEELYDEIRAVLEEVLMLISQTIYKLGLE